MTKKSLAPPLTPRGRPSDRGGQPASRRAARVDQTGSGAVPGDPSSIRQAAWRALLPSHVVGTVVLADLNERTTESLLLSYPSALVLSRSKPSSPTRRAVVWDGVSAPLRPRRVSLLVVDDRHRGLRPLSMLMSDEGQLAAIVSSRLRYDFALYPSPDALDWVTRSGWPISPTSSLRKQLAQARAVSPAWRFLPRSGLLVKKSGPSLVEEILGQISNRIGSPLELKGLRPGRGRGQILLRVRSATAEFAVRVGFSDRGLERIALHRSMLDLLSEIPDKPFGTPTVVASGWVGNARWLAEEWLPGRPGPGGRAWAPAGPGWTVAMEIARSLGELGRTGVTGRGWAEGWATPVLSPFGDTRETLLRGLGPLDHRRMPTGWMHGDLWPGNILLRRRSSPIVIDWDRARPDAPVGLDAVSVEVSRTMHSRGVDWIGGATALLAGSQEGLRDVEVGGRTWQEWDDEIRRSLILAALMTNTSAGSSANPRDREWTYENLRRIASVVNS
jgi:Phosphotransferase enzyme family